ncbi:MAG: ParB/RepB/Spo0J family partition protein [Oscillochloridaceae bacterium umkhey_bin13]
MSRRRGLGSGLAALIPSSQGESNLVRQIPVEAVRQNRSQPRSHFDEQALEELAASIRAHGVIQPIIVSEDQAGGYELIAGERRWRAAQRAGLNEVPALVKNATTPQELLELALVENVQRADLNALEEGLAYQTLKDEFGLTDELIAQRVGKSRVAVVNTRRLIKLSPPARQALLDGTISAGHGRALLRLEAEPDQVAALELMQRRELSVREAERLAELGQHPQLLPAARAALFSGALSTNQAQALLRIEEPAAQATTLDLILTQSLNAREAEQVADRVAEGADPATALASLRNSSPTAPAEHRPPQRPQPEPDAERPARRPDPADDEARRLFEGLLETPVQIARHGREIRLTITFYSDEQLNALYERLGGEA